MILNSSLSDCQHNPLPLLPLNENGVPATDATAKLAKKQAITKQAFGNKSSAHISDQSRVCF